MQEVAWHRATAALPGGEYSLVFEATFSAQWSADNLALDNIEVNDGPCNFSGFFFLSYSALRVLAFHLGPTATDNKFAQSSLGRGPRRGAVAQIRRKVPIGYNGAPQIRLQ